MTGAYVLYAVIVAAVVSLAWLLIFGCTQDRPEHPPEPGLRAAQHRVSDSGERT